MYRLAIALSIFFGAALLSSPSPASDQDPNQDPKQDPKQDLDQPGNLSSATLESIKSRDFDSLQQAPEANWAHYDAVHILLPEVTFRKNWQRDQNRYDSQHVRDRDVERIRGDMAELVQEVLRDQFAEQGWRLSDQAAPQVLVLRPNLVDLDIIAPDVPGTTLRETYSDSAGSVTFDLTIMDGESGDTLLTTVDHREDPRDNFLQWRKRPINLNQARIMVRGWARDLLDVLGSKDV